MATPAESTSNRRIPPSSPFFSHMRPVWLSVIVPSLLSTNGSVVVAVLGIVVVVAVYVVGHSQSPGTGSHATSSGQQFTGSPTSGQQASQP